jgi:CRP-like cAMP-binding protein
MHLALRETALPSAENHLIELLPRHDCKRLLAACTAIDLSLGEVLYERGSATRHVYFPVDGNILLVAQGDDHPGIEVGMVGREGMLGLHLALGVVNAPLYAVVQGAGRAWRMTASDLRRELRRGPALRRILDRYTLVSMSQLAVSAACARFHQIGPRLARWLLMSQDRTHANSFHATQEFLAYMLGVRRVGITVAASCLQRDGLIEYSRGTVKVLDRPGLEAAACACYAADASSYAALL